MTICVSVRVPDGLVLGTDSMSILIRERSVVMTYRNARKLTQVGDLSIGLFVYGDGVDIGEKFVLDMVREFVEINTHSTVEDIAVNLSCYIAREYVREYEKEYTEVFYKPKLGLYLAGYSKGSKQAEEWEIIFPEDPTPKKVRQNEEFGVVWRGETTPFTRLYRGYDPDLLQFIKASEMPPQRIKQIEEENEFRTQILFNSMPLQDAVDFAAFVLRTTIGYKEFEIYRKGVPTCGGSLQVAAITPEGGYHWVQESQLHLKEDSDDWT